MQNAISTDQFVLMLVNAELTQGRALKDIFDKGVGLIDYDKNNKLRVVMMKGATLKRRFYSAKQKHNIDHIRNQHCQFMGRDLVLSSTFEPAVKRSRGRPRKKIITKTI